MPPYSPSARLVHNENNQDGHQDNLGQNSRNRAQGFTSPMLDLISKSKSKIHDWVDHEKSKIDSRLECYCEKLVEEKTNIDSQVVELTHVQRERGINDKIFENGNSSSNDHQKYKDHPENIFEQKKALEKQSAKVQIDIMKLKTERENRKKRVQDIALEESKQRIRASDAAALKSKAEESKKTTIDDLTRGVVNYKKLGLDFTQTGRDAQVQLNFTEINPDDPSRIFSFVLLVNDDERYDVINCDPRIDSKEMLEILDELNNSCRDDISILARRMRKAFKEVCTRTQIKVHDLSSGIINFLNSD